MSKQMHILLWVFQIIFAFYYLAGGVYMMGHYEILATAGALQVLPKPVWLLLGLLQVLGAVGLVSSGVFKNPKLTSISAIGLGVISLLGSVLYVSYRGVGILWAIVPAIFLGIIVYKRWR